MSGDLISRSALLEDFRNTITGKSDTMDWLNMISRQPAAYDVDKVVERLELLSEDAEYNDLCTYEEKTAYSTAYSKAAEIVKAEYGRCGMTERGG